MADRRLSAWLVALLARLTDGALAESIAGDLQQERRRRAAAAPVRAAVWFWGASLGIALHVAARRAAGAVHGLAAALWPGGGRGEWRQALRSLRRTPWYALTAVGVIALSMALATTVFAIVDGVLFKPLPYPGAEQLVSLRGSFNAVDVPGMRNVSVADVRAWRRAAPDVRFALMSVGGAVTISDNDFLHDAEVGRSFFDVLGVRPLQGGFADADFGPATRVRPIVLMYDAWQQRFGGDPGIVGRTLVDATGEGARIVGVMPREFLFPFPLPASIPTESLSPLPDPTGVAADRPTARNVQVIARMPAGVTPPRLQQALQPAVRDVADRFPVLTPDPAATATRLITRGPFDVIRAEPLRDVLAASTHSVSAVIFATAAALVLLASLNLAGLATGHVLDRRRELALRRTLGGTGWSLVRALSVEHAVVVTGGSAAGLALTFWSFPIVLHLVPRGSTLLKAPALDWRVAVFAVGASAACLAVITALSARAVLRASAASLSTESSRATDASGRGRRAALIAGQVAVALVMALGGALLAASLAKVWSEDPGVQVDGRARIRVNSPVDFDLAMLNELTGTLAHVPGVAAVGGMDETFLEHAINGSRFDPPPGMTRGTDVEELSVTSGFFAATGLRALGGRLPTAEEFDTGQPVIVVSQRVAAMYWPGKRAAGQVLLRDGRPFEVIGVVPDVRHAALDRDSDGEIYSPDAVQPRPDLMNLIVAFDSNADIHAGLSRVLAEMAARFPTIKVRRAESMAQALGASVGTRRFQTWLFVSFGAAALAIVGVGILGVIAMAVGRRTREVGIRMALGARWTSVVGMILREQAMVVGIGLATGGVASAWLVRYLGDYLYKMSVYDWRAWGGAVAALTGVALAAAMVPALRASRVDPVTALRTD